MREPHEIAEDNASKRDADAKVLKAAAMLACVAAARAYNIGRRDGFKRSPDVSMFPQARPMQDAIAAGDLEQIQKITDEIRAANEAALAA